VGCLIILQAVPHLRLLVACFSALRPGFISVVLHVGFVVLKKFHFGRFPSKHIDFALID